MHIHKQRLALVEMKYLELNVQTDGDSLILSSHEIHSFISF